jgi:hypothetical protein
MMTGMLMMICVWDIYTPAQHMPILSHRLENREGQNKEEVKFIEKRVLIRGLKGTWK